MKKALISILLLPGLCLMTAFSLSFFLSPAFALDTGTWESFLAVRTEAPQADADTLGLKKDTRLPVLSAPFEEAWRGAKGKAAVSLREPFTLLGTLQDQTWAMISYSVGKGEGRIGWVQIDPARAALPSASDLTVERRLCRVVREASATDDPNGGGRVVRTLSPGEEVIAVLVYGDWICAETQVNGQIAWLFIPEEALEEIPLFSVENHTVRVDDRVTVMGSGSFAPPGSENPADDNWCLRTVIRPGDLRVPCLDFNNEEIFGPWDGQRWQLLLPASLRMLGSEAFLYANPEELRLPEGLSFADTEALYGCSIGRLLIPAGYDTEVPGGYHLRVGAYEAEEGCARYRTADGVLFSGDGKTLLRYPQSKADTHYTVPAGVEVIASHAFSGDAMDLPLQSISLPIGLRRIEDYAFEGCGRLLSLTVPLTVTEIGDRAFSCCVSLERLSLPPGFSASFHEDDCARQADFTWYNGDNGETLSAPDPDEYDEDDLFRQYGAWIDNPAGEGSEALFGDEALTREVQQLPVGTGCRVADVRNGIAKVALGFGSNAVKGYISMERLQTCQDGPTLFEPAGVIEVATGRKWAEWDYGRQGYTVTVRVSDDQSESFSAEELLQIGEGGSDRELALLIAGPGEAIRFYDQPEGTETVHTYDGVQAIVLARGNGWVRVQTAAMEGWVREFHVWRVVTEGSF